MARKNLKTQISHCIYFFRDYPGFPNVQADEHGRVDPVSKQQFEALVAAFEERATSSDHLERLSAELQRSMKFCPKPPEVHEAADRLAERASVRDWSGSKPVCPHGLCDGGGFLVGRTAEGIDLANYCRCHAAFREPKGAAARAAS